LGLADRGAAEARQNQKERLHVAAAILRGEAQLVLAAGRDGDDHVIGLGNRHEEHRITFTGCTGGPSAATMVIGPPRSEMVIRGAEALMMRRRTAHPGLPSMRVWRWPLMRKAW
jgi:hypothetical protein